MPALDDLKKLRELDLNDNNIDTAEFLAWANLESIRYIKLSENKLSNIKWIVKMNYFSRDEKLD